MTHQLEHATTEMLKAITNGNDARAWMFALEAAHYGQKLLKGKKR